VTARAMTASHKKRATMKKNRDAVGSEIGRRPKRAGSGGGKKSGKRGGGGMGAVNMLGRGAEHTEKMLSKKYHNRTEGRLAGGKSGSRSIFEIKNCGRQTSLMERIIKKTA